MKRSKGFVAAMATLVSGTFLLSAVASAEMVGIGTKVGSGKYLTDAKGMTLYVFMKDTQGKSACAGPCVEKWPLFNAEKVEVKEGLKAEDFGAITREDGKRQTTYRGMPLYYFFKDAKPGDTNGQGVNNVWFLVGP